MAFWVPAVLNNREEMQPKGVRFEHLMHHWSTEKDQRTSQGCQPSDTKKRFWQCQIFYALGHQLPCAVGVVTIQATTPPPQLVLTGAEMENARKSPNRTMSLVPGAASLHTWHCRGPYSPRYCTTSMSGPWGTDPQPPGKPQEQIPVDDPQAEVGIKPHLSSRTEWLRKCAVICKRTF